jgi:hypothetical protein
MYFLLYKSFISGKPKPAPPPRSKSLEVLEKVDNGDQYQPYHDYIPGSGLAGFNVTLDTGSLDNLLDTTTTSSNSSSDLTPRIHYSEDDLSPNGRIHYSKDDITPRIRFSEDDITSSYNNLKSSSIHQSQDSYSSISDHVQQQRENAQKQQRTASVRSGEVADDKIASPPPPPSVTQSLNNHFIISGNIL